MSMTFSGMAKVASQAAMAVGQAQASMMGLGKSEAGALAVTSLMGGGSGGGLSGAPATKAEFGAAVVTQTISKLSQGGRRSSGAGAGMDFQMSVLGAGLGKGGIISSVG